MVNYQINFLEQTKGNLISERQAFVEGELGEITHDYVVSPELPSINTQYINRIYSTFLESGDNEEVIIEAYVNLLAVASQCPAAGGQSVYRARAMLAMINDSLEYADAIVCLQSGIYREAVVENNLFDIEIIPNPASDLVSVNVKYPQKGFCNIKILNSLGELIYNIKINCELTEHNINVQKLTPGVYFMNLDFEGAHKAVKKLIIIK
jgi:hypothetical protein